MEFFGCDRYNDDDLKEKRKYMIPIPEMLFENSSPRRASIESPRRANPENTGILEERSEPRMTRKRNPRIICKPGAFAELFKKQSEEPKAEEKQEITYESIMNEKINMYKKEINSKKKELEFYRNIRLTITELKKEKQEIINEIEEIKREIGQYC